MGVPTMCSTRGAFFEPLSTRKDRVRLERAERRREAVMRYAQQQRELAKKGRQTRDADGRSARGAFHADSQNPTFDGLKGKKWNW